jgi:hypothetical protein
MRDVIWTCLTRDPFVRFALIDCVHARKSVREAFLQKPICGLGPVPSPVRRKHVHLHFGRSPGFPAGGWWAIRKLSRNGFMGNA